MKKKIIRGVRFLLGLYKMGNERESGACWLFLQEEDKGERSWSGRMRWRRNERKPEKYRKSEKSLDFSKQWRFSKFYKNPSWQASNPIGNYPKRVHQNRKSIIIWPISSWIWNQNHQKIPSLQNFHKNKITNKSLTIENASFFIKWNFKTIRVQNKKCSA